MVEKPYFILKSSIYEFYFSIFNLSFFLVIIVATSASGLMFKIKLSVHIYNEHYVIEQWKVIIDVVNNDAYIAVFESLWTHYSS